MNEPLFNLIECQDLDGDTWILKSGTILYSGNTMSKEVITLQDIFQYIGQRGKEYSGNTFVLYASTNYDVAWGYASSCQQSGYIHKFIVERDLTMLKGDIFEDAELVAKCVCEKGYDGYAVLYSDTQNEFALCNSSRYLQYLASIKCIQNKEEWLNVVNPSGLNVVNPFGLNILGDIELELQDYIEDVGIVGQDLLYL